MSFKKLKTAFKLSVTGLGLIALPFVAPQQTHAAEAVEKPVALNAEFGDLIHKAVDDAARASVLMEGVSVAFTISKAANEGMGYTTDDFANIIRDNLALEGVESQYFSFPSNDKYSRITFFFNAEPDGPLTLEEAALKIPEVVKRAKKLHAPKEQPIEKPVITPEVTKADLRLYDKRDVSSGEASMLASRTYENQITLIMYGSNKETFRNAVTAGREALANGVPVVALYLAKHVGEDGKELQGVAVKYGGSTISINEDGKVFLSSTKEKIAEEINFANTLRLEKEAKAEKDRIPLIP